jgi:tRNA threonylcarbamoyladenosine biosynthesis protein TsaE
MLRFENIGIEDMPLVASSVLNTFPQERFYVFRGQMGAGKTTLIKLLCEKLGVEGFTSSPTYSLVNEYFSRLHGPVFHFDFYRIKTLEEVYDIGYEDYFFSDSYCLVEWAEKIPELLPSHFVEVKIETADNHRNIYIKLLGLLKE